MVNMQDMLLPSLLCKQADCWHWHMLAMSHLCELGTHPKDFILVCAADQIYMSLPCSHTALPAFSFLSSFCPLSQFAAFCTPGKSGIQTAAAWQWPPDSGLLHQRSRPESAGARFSSSSCQTAYRGCIACTAVSDAGANFAYDLAVV